MASQTRTLKQVLDSLSGLRLPSGRLFERDGDSLLVARRMLRLPGAGDPYQFLDKVVVHDKCLELMENCHIQRDLMYNSGRMEDVFWERVQASTSWAGQVPRHIIRTLALKLTQAAWAHHKNPKSDITGEPDGYCKLAIAALRFANDIFVYEDFLWEDEGDPARLNFQEFRGPVYLPNGRLHVDSDGKAYTQPVFPLASLRHRPGLRPRGLSSNYRLTSEDPEWFESLRRV